MKRKALRTVFTVSAVVIAAAVIFGAYVFFASDTPRMTSLRRRIKYEVLNLSTVNDRKETSGLGKDYTLTEYENGEVRTGEFDRWQDNHRVYDDGKISRLVCYYGGYQLDFPTGAQYDFDYSAGYVKISGEGYSAVISREYAPYQSVREIKDFALDSIFPFLGLNRGVEDYISYYEYRFLLSKDWQRENGVAVTDESYGKVLMYNAVLSDAPEEVFDGYTFVTVLKQTREYIRAVFRYDADDSGMRDFFRKSVKSMRVFDPYGNGHYSTDFSPAPTDGMSEETRAVYESLSSSDSVVWGIFTKNVETEGINETIPALEEKLGYGFGIVLDYTHLILNGKTGGFPTAFMEKCRGEGKLVELTYQLTDNNNENLYARSVFLDVYRGKYDGEIRRFAKDAAAFSHPFLFRLNNEPNSDWCTYSGVANLCDPEIFGAVWRRIYGIFREEGVDNCIWVYNPNDRNCPPSIWNDSLAYYPGNGYVNIFGVTGYNNGTYYTKWGESWREFDEIYTNIENLYLAHFGEFPWMITEFASSSHGGDKAAWIDNMFDKIGNYKNINAAVWFSYADYDGQTPARPYFLDETDETLEAFRRGLGKREK